MALTKMALHQKGIITEVLLKKRYCGVHSQVFVAGQSKLCILGQGLSSNGTLLLQFSSYAETAGIGQFPQDSGPGPDPDLDQCIWLRALTGYQRSTFLIIVGETGYDER